MALRLEARGDHLHALQACDHAEITPGSAGEDRVDGLLRADVRTEWRLIDGHLGCGLSEHLDRVIDGRPVGPDE